MDNIEKRILDEVLDIHKMPEGAMNIRLNGEAAERRSTANIDITSRPDGSGINIDIKQFYTAYLYAGAAFQSGLGLFGQIDPQIFHTVFVQTAVHDSFGMDAGRISGAMGVAATAGIFFNHLLTLLELLKADWAFTPFYAAGAGM